MTVPPEVTGPLDALLHGTREALADNLVGVYLRGSLATGDFLATSDLDVLTVTERPVGEAEFVALRALHARLAALPGDYSGRFEVAYIDRAALRRFTPGRRHLTLYWNEPLAWSEHGANWILERWTVREHGVPMCGPEPKTLIEAIAPDELREAVRGRLRDWAAWAEQPDDPDWPILYTVETMCRALYTLAHGALPSKARAVEWALATLPEPWRTIVGQAPLWRAGAACDRATSGPEVRRFVRAVAAAATPDASDRYIFQS